MGGQGASGMFGLLQLADSCFPAGGFAFSNGLEGLAKSGWLRGIEDFRQYLECYLGQVASADLPFLNSAFNLAAPEDPVTAPNDQGAAQDDQEAGPNDRTSGPGDGFAEVAWEWDAFLSLPSPRRASLAQGQAWLRAVEGAHGHPTVQALRPWFKQRELPAHFLMAFAASLRILDFSLAEAQSLLLHMALRDQLGAAVRLGLIGSLQAQGFHSRFLAVAETLRIRHGSLTHHRSCKTAPMIEMGQAGHPYLYSKLFQS